MFYEYNHLGSPNYLKIEHRENFSFPLHLHQCFEIIILLSGQMQVRVGNQEILLQKGEGIMIFPNQIHALESTKSEHVLCIFSPSLVMAYSQKVMDKLPKEGKFCPDLYLVNTLVRMESTASIMEKKGLLYSLCAQFHRDASYVEKQTGKESLLHRIFSFMEENYNGNCTLYNLAHQLGYEHVYLSRVFKQSVGVSYKSYVNRYRLSHACYLMENTDHTILQCAMESGFGSLRNFNRNFKEEYGCTPTQFRKNVKSCPKISD